MISQIVFSMPAIPRVERRSFTDSFTPLTETGQAAADITLAFDIIDNFDWQPCMELEPATDVIITIKKLDNDGDATVLIDFTCLEVTL